MPSYFGDSQDAKLYKYVNERTAQPLSKNVFHPNGCSSVLLGVNPPRSMFRNTSSDYGGYWNLSATRGHGICFSTTGGGKNTNIITPALLSYAGNVLCLDPKGENAWITANRRRQLGQKVVILDPWNQVNTFYGSLAGVLETATRFNPLSTLDPKSPEFSEEITLIADGVIITPERADPHWGDSARELVSGLIAAVVESSPGVASFRNVRDLITDTDERLSAAVEGIVAKNPNSLAARKLRRFLPKKSFDKDGHELSSRVSNEIGSIRSTAETQTAIFDAAKLLDSMETAGSGSFELSELMTGKVSLFIVLPPEKLLTHGRWMRLIIQLALRAIARVPAVPRFPVLFLLDELGTINPGAGLKMIEQAYGLLGAQGIRIFSFFQNLGQLRHDYPNSWETMLANSQVTVVMKLNDNTTSQYFSDKLGTEPWGEGRRPVMSPYALEHLPENDAITMQSGADNLQLPTVPYFLEPRWNGFYRPNPRYSLPAWAAQLPNPYTFDPRKESLPAPAPAAARAPAAIGLDRLKAGVDTLGTRAAGWWQSRQQAAADAARARETAKSEAEREAREAASLAERARHAQMRRDAK